MRSVSRIIIAVLLMSLAACVPQGSAPPGAPGVAQPPAQAAAVSAQPSAPAAAPSAGAPAARPAPGLAALPQAPIPPGSTIIACTPIEDVKPPPGQVAVAQPFSLVLDASGRPLQFVGGVLPAKIPFQVSSIAPAAGPPEMRVGALIRYASRDTAHEMYTALAIMKDHTYRLGLMVKTPTQSTNGPVIVGHGTCADRAA